MNEQPEAIRVVQQWVELAEEDRTNAEHTLTLHEHCPFRTVCFHCQQCVEKYLKALLILRSVPFPRTHDLSVLLSLLPPDVELATSQRDIETLTQYAVETRYPGWPEPVTRLEAEHAFEVMDEVRDAIRKLLPLADSGEA